MKKEIEIEFKDLKAKLKENLIIGVYINEEKVDEITLQKDCVFIRADIPVCLILRIEDCLSLKDYLDIPEIKELHDKHFKKEVDLFGFVETQEYAFAVDVYGKVFGLLTTNEIIEKFKKNYNLLPKGTLAENASVMSLDERKQYLFAIAKGYEVLTREEALELSEFDWRGVISLFRNKNNKFEVNGNSLDATSNIYFKKSKHAQECADFMNGSENKE